MNQSTNKKKTTSNVETRMLFARYVEGGLPSVFRLQNLKTKFPFLYFFFAAVGNGRNEKQFTEKKKKKRAKSPIRETRAPDAPMGKYQQRGAKKKKRKRKKNLFFLGRKKNGFARRSETCQPAGQRRRRKTP